MSAPLPLSDSCCVPACAEQVTVQVPGPAGQNGTNGQDGDPGINAFTTTTDSFVQPNAGDPVTVEVENSAWAANGQVVYVTTGGSYTVTGIPDATHLTLTNLDYPGNAAPATNITSPQQVSPGGLEGPTGTSPSISLNDLSPTDTKGDLLVDTGAASPSANLVRQAVGSDGQILTADSTQATGQAWKTTIPITGTDNSILRLNGAAGTPIPLQESGLIITDAGAIQSTPTGGNARGTGAVDLQVSRSAATQVASGNNGVIAGGVNNTASASNSAVLAGNGNIASGGNSAVCAGAANNATATNSFVGGGNTNDATGSASTIGGGFNNEASTDNTTVAGGSNNLASGSASTVGGGLLNTASGDYSTVSGGRTGVASLYGQDSYAAGRFAANGDCQFSQLIWRISTTDATPTEAFLDGAGIRAIIPLNKTWGFEIIATGRSSVGVGACWKVTGAIQNNANTVTLVSAVATTMLADGTGTTWGVAGNIAVTADNVNKALAIIFTGAALTNIRFGAHAKMMEIGY